MALTQAQAADLPAAIESMQLQLCCPDFAASLQFYTEVLGLHVAMIMPADDPDEAVLEGHGLSLHLQRSGAQAVAAPVRLLLRCDSSQLSGTLADEITAPEGTRIRIVASAAQTTVPAAIPMLNVARSGDSASWIDGRAGMRYRDLIPGRWGGRYVASHIRIDQAGPVDDYVHYHHVRFQMIYCRAGWVRVVYEDQGPPFVLHAGDCVLQPPQIRHRVLESSAGLEVVEIGCPAIHPTHGDSALSLPNVTIDPSRRFADQRFVRHIATDAEWTPVPGSMAVRDTQIADATRGLARVDVLRATAEARLDLSHSDDFQFLYALNGGGKLLPNDAEPVDLATDDALSLPPNEKFLLAAAAGSEWLRVRL